jgi:hypothetical protein
MQRIIALDRYAAEHHEECRKLPKSSHLDRKQSSTAEHHGGYAHLHHRGSVNGGLSCAFTVTRVHAMPRAQRNTLILRHEVVQHLSSTVRPATSIGSQCHAVVIRLDEIGAFERVSDMLKTSADTLALESLPDPLGWGGSAIVPWGHPNGGGRISGAVTLARAGRNGVYFRAGTDLCDSMRDVFMTTRYLRGIAAPWTSRRDHDCGCLMVTDTRAVTTDDAVDTDGQLELMRRVLRRTSFRRTLSAAARGYGVSRARRRRAADFADANQRRLCNAAHARGYQAGDEHRSSVAAGAAPAGRRPTAVAATAQRTA